MDGLQGQALAEEALRVFRIVEAKYPTGITIAELEEELRAQRVRIASDNYITALGSALNASQKRGTWFRVGEGIWRPGSGLSQMENGLSGKPLADALYPFVVERYPNREFHYEKARLELVKSGVAVKGTGSTMRGALVGSPDRFEPVIGKRGYWRWKK